MPENVIKEPHGYPNREAYWIKYVEENGPEAVAGKLLELEYNSNHDTLTGLLNRRGLEEGIAYAAALVKRSKSPLSFLFMDMDGLKDINDNLGHGKGDEALKQVADAIDKLRGIDIAGRWGGDEFLVLLPYTNQEGAFLLVDKIKDELKLKGALTTISIGVGVWNGIEDPQQTINEADRSMNLLKHSVLAKGERSKGIGVVTLE